MFRLEYVVIVIFLLPLSSPLSCQKLFFSISLIFFSPLPPFLFINSPRAVELSKKKIEITIKNFLMEE